MRLEIDTSAITTRARVVATMLVLAAADVAEQCTKDAQDAFAEALTAHVRAEHPDVPTVTYDRGQSPHDEAFRLVQKAALEYSCRTWDNGRETTEASADLDFGQLFLDEALDSYTNAYLEAAGHTEAAPKNATAAPLT